MKDFLKKGLILLIHEDFLSEAINKSVLYQIITKTEY